MARASSVCYSSTRHALKYDRRTEVRSTKGSDLARASALAFPGHGPTTGRVWALRPSGERMRRPHVREIAFSSPVAWCVPASLGQGSGQGQGLGPMTCPSLESSCPPGSCPKRAWSRRVTETRTSEPLELLHDGFPIRRNSSRAAPSVVQLVWPAVANPHDVGMEGVEVRGKLRSRISALRTCQRVPHSQGNLFLGLDQLSGAEQGNPPTSGD